MKVVETPTTLDPNQVIATLEKMLARAKAGELESVLCIALARDGCFDMECSGYDDILRQIGAMEMLKHDLLSDAAGE